MMTSFSFDPLLRGIALPKCIPPVARAAVERVEAKDAETVYRATIYDVVGIARVHCVDTTPESAMRGACLGLLAAVARLTDVDVAADQARVVRLTLN